MKLYCLVLLSLIACMCQMVWAGVDRPVLTLNQALEMALANHPALQMSGPAADIAQAHIEGERSALYPKVTGRFVFPFVGTESGVSLQQYIWDFRQTQHRIQASRAQAQASGFEQAVQREDVILNVKVAYYTVLSRQQVETEAEHQVRILQKRLEQLENLFNLGRRSRTELAQARMNLDEGQLSVTTVRYDVENARIQLAHAMGLTTTLSYDLAPEVDYDKRDVDLAQTLQRALANRSELHLQDAQIAALKSQADAAKQAVYPSIYGRLAYRIEGEGADQPGFVVGIGVQGTIFDGFATRAKRREAEAQVRRAKAEMAVQQQQLAMEVQQAALRLQLAMEHMQIRQHAQYEAQEHLQVANEQFRLGRISAIDMAEAEWLVVSATAKRLQSVYNAKIALAQLERATGRDIDP